MAKVRSNPLVRGISGKIGNLVFRPMPGGETYVSGVPDFSNRKFSKGQKEHQSRFKEASAYARGAAKTQPVYAQLAEGTVMSAYNFALSDWFNPPVIHRVERTGNLVRVEASDNVMVARVQVTVVDGEGKVLEKGEAANTEGPSSRSGWWEAAVTAQGEVWAEAWDLAGNRVKGKV